MKNELYSKRMAQNACIASLAKRGGMRQYSQKTEALAMLVDGSAKAFINAYDNREC